MSTYTKCTYKRVCMCVLFTHIHATLHIQRKTYAKLCILTGVIKLTHKRETIKYIFNVIVVIVFFLLSFWLLKFSSAVL